MNQTKPNRLHLAGVLAVVVLLAVAAWIYLTRDSGKVLQVATATAKYMGGVGVVDGARFTEDYVDKTILTGMDIPAVEAILGPPYMKSPFMGSVRASYRIEGSATGGMRMTAFVVVYKDGRVSHVDKSWGMH